MEIADIHTKFSIRSLLPLTALLGILSVTTLAIWTATTVLRATFTTANYTAIEASTDNVGWGQHNQPDSAGALQVSYGPSAIVIAPGHSATSPLALRTEAGTTGPVDVAIDTVISGGASTAGLTYELFRTAAWGCDSTTQGDAIVPEFTTLDSGSAAGATFQLAAGTAIAPGTPTFLCLKVTAASVISDQAQVDVSWVFTGSHQ
ncbi:MAG: hypothetical protein ACKOXM_00560 [Agromyces sp.]